MTGIQGARAAGRARGSPAAKLASRQKAIPTVEPTALTARDELGGERLRRTLPSEALVAAVRMARGGMSPTLARMSRKKRTLTPVKATAAPTIFLRWNGSMPKSRAKRDVERGIVA
jgi:hypothetical protein